MTNSVSDIITSKRKLRERISKHYDFDFLKYCVMVDQSILHLLIKMFYKNVNNRRSGEYIPVTDLITLVEYAASLNILVVACKKLPSCLITDKVGKLMMDKALEMPILDYELVRRIPTRMKTPEFVKEILKRDPQCISMDDELWSTTLGQEIIKENNIAVPAIPKKRFSIPLSKSKTTSLG